MFPSATAAKWYQARLKWLESLERKGTVWERLKADLPVRVSLEGLSIGMKTASAGLSHPSAPSMGQNPNPFGNGNRVISHPGCLGWLYPSELAAVSVPLGKGKAGDGAMVLLCPEEPVLVASSLQPP